MYSFISASYYVNYGLAGGFKYFLCSSLFGEDFQFDLYFSNGLNPPTSFHSSVSLIILWVSIHGLSLQEGIFSYFFNPMEPNNEYVNRSHCKFQGCNGCTYQQFIKLNQALYTYYGCFLKWWYPPISTPK